MSTKKKTCETCVFWHVPKGSSIDVENECRRYPPRRIINSESEFPETYHNDWCGEYKKDEKK